MRYGDVERRLAGVLLVAVALGGCSSSGGSTGPGPTPAISLSLSSTSASVAQGGSTTVTATLTRSGGFTGVVDLTVSGAPAGVTGTVSNPTTSGGTTTATVTIDVAASTAPGTYPLTLTGTGSGVSNATATFTLTVTVTGNYTLAADPVNVVQGGNANSAVTITRTGGFTGSVAFTADVVPAGLSAQFAPTSTTGNGSTLTITATAGIAPGNYTVGIRGTTAGLTDQTASVAVTVVAAPGFTLAGTAVNVAQAGNANSTVTITRVGGFTGSVALTATSVPAGLGATFNPTSTAGNTSTLTVTATAGMAPGNYTIGIQGSANGVADQTASVAVTVTVTGSYTLAGAPVNVAQGGNANSAVTITRTGGFTGSVALTADVVPAGLTAQFAPTSTTGNTSTLTITATAGIAPGNYTVGIRGTTAGLADQTASVAVTVTTAPGFTIAGTAVNLQQSANANSTVTITRVGGFTGSVALSTTSVPAGLGANFNPPSTTGNTSTLTITANGSITPGNYTIGIKGSASGLPDQTASIAVTVSASTGGSGNAQINLSCFGPIWVAYQDGNGAWTQATSVGAGVYKISVTGSSAGVAWVFASAGGFQTQVIYFPAAFLTGSATVSLCGSGSTPGTKSIGGTVTGISGGDRAYMSMGSSTGIATTFNLNFGLNSVLNGNQDLLGWRHDPAGETGGVVNPDRGFVRRDQNIANGGSVGTIDFAGAESFTPATGTITLPGVVAGEKITHGVQYLTTPACVSGLLYQTSAGDTPPLTARGFPASVQRSDDYHYLFVSAVTGSGTPIIGHTSSRTVFQVFHTMTDMTVNLPPSIAGTAVTTLSGPYKRLQAVYPNTSQFNLTGSLVYSTTTPLRIVAVVINGNLLTNGQVTVAMPDFTGVAGFDPNWMPGTAATGTWSVQTAGSTQTGSNVCQEGLQSWSASALGTF